MQMTFRILIKFSLILFCSQLVFSQTKKEKEERISLSEFPLKAQNIINDLPEDCKRVRYYKETDGDKQSFEAKFKYKRRRYSLEFSLEGAIEDIEVIIKLSTIKKNTQTQITSYFKSSYLNYKLFQIQEQYVFDGYSNIDIFIANVLNQRSTDTVNYEIIAEVKTDNGREIREFTFDHNGSFLNFRVVEPSSYAHVLY